MAKNPEKRIAAQKALLASKIGGGEPTWLVAPRDADLAILRAYNWYSEYSSPKDEKSWFKEYVRVNLKADETVLAKLDALPLPTFAWVGRSCRMLMLSAPFCPKSESRILERITGVLQMASAVRLTSESVDTVSVQDRVREKSREIIGNLLVALETQIRSIDKKGKSPSTFSMKSWLESQSIKAAYCEPIIRWIADNEMEDYRILCDKNPPADFVEAYSHLTKKQIAAILSLYQEVIADTKAYAGQVKASAPVRKARKRKPKSPIKQVAKLKYTKEFILESKTYKSVASTNLCGAQYALVYNTKLRKLLYFVADSAAGFTVKGSTLLGWNADESKVYRLRKPEVALPILTKSGVGIREVKALLKSLTTKPTTPKGRINKDCAILNTI